MKVLITGCAGLIGSEAVSYYSPFAELVIGIDNNARQKFFGPSASVLGRLSELQSKYTNFNFYNFDIRDETALNKLFIKYKPDLIIHCAAQPSHDLAANIPIDDFTTNALATLYLLEATKKHCMNSPFVFLSTNKVYGDRPNSLDLIESELRWDFADDLYTNGINENFAIDQTTHSLFGVSKLSADLLTQEYGRYFDMKTVCFRGGCLTGPSHAGAEAHGFLSYLFKTANQGKQYTIYGYKGKQVRDQIHSYDVIAAIDCFFKKAKSGGHVYNIGGGKANSLSVLESINKIQELTGKSISYSISDKHRIGDHICYYTDMSQFQRDYPEWQLTYSLDRIFEDYFSQPG